MKVLLTFDVEVWCNGWDDLDGSFPQAYERYVFGRSRHGDWALPKTLEILARYGLRGVFFVEPLFSARFGAEHLERLVRLIRDAGQEIQLHIHPEWTDEIAPPIIDDSNRKRQHLIHYTLDEQTQLIAYARSLLESAGSGLLTAFRAGSYAADRATYVALSRNGFSFDSSLNRCYDVSGPDLPGLREQAGAFDVEGVTSLPVSVFRDGLGRVRPAQVGACSAAELQSAIRSAESIGWPHFVVVSHNFEMLKPGSTARDVIVAQRFESLCRWLAGQGPEIRVCGFDDLASEAQPATGLPRAPMSATVRRYTEQALRRLV